VSSPGPDPQRFVIVPHRPRLRTVAVVVAVAWALSLVAAAWLAARWQAPVGTGGTFGGHSELAKLNDQVAELRQQVTTLRRSDQISRNANVELQATLAEREEEISGLRADVAFYERLVGSTGQRRGLNAHEAVFTPESAGTWHYTITLTQNLNRGAISKGTMRFAVDGVRAGKLASLKWEELLQKPGAPGQPFSFRYFEQLEGSVMLPPGFTPQRVRVQLSANGGGNDQVFDWSETKNQGG
jgi:transposase-like protein